MKSILPTIVILAIMVTACNKNEPANTVNTDNSVAKTSVTIGYPSDSVDLDETVSLNATASYLLKSDVKANTNGYIVRNNIKLAQNVQRGQVLFKLQTKESRALGNTINELDPSFRFSGYTSVVSPASGYVYMLNHQSGDYVQDGEILATVTDQSSFGFVMNLPYEYNQMVSIGKNLIVSLPDGRELNGYVAQIMPSVDPVSQTEKVLIKIRGNTSIPENLIANIILTKKEATKIAIPKDAVLTDDSQSKFWVMKLINDSTAIKTDFSKGIENNQWVEVLDGNISNNDKLVTSGNYGMSDTAYVKINP